MTVEEWLGKDNVLGIDIWNKKYRHGDETFDEWLDRVSGGNKKTKDLIANKQFLFGGRILSNRGIDMKEEKSTMSNCYVISPPEDNIESIYDTCKKLARTYSLGGGCGIDISKLAPAGAKVRNQAKSTSGAVSFMDTFSQVTEQIGQKGRRGALMISLDCRHPDVQKFITIKSDLGKVTYANISVRITDEFMQAVENDADWELRFERPETKEVITNSVKAKELFELLCEQNWNYAEPGILFWDRICNYNLLNNNPEFEYAGVNPCFAGNMRLLTSEGYRTFEELCDTEPYIINVDGNVVKSKVWCSGIKETVCVKTGHGDIICTPDHIFMTENGDECMAKDLAGKKIMPMHKCNRIHDDLYVKLGFMQGDGQLNRLGGEWHHGIEVNIGKKDGDIKDLFADDDWKKKSDRAIYVRGYSELMKQLEFSAENLPYRVLPKTYHCWTKSQKAAFLSGCYSANGCVVTNSRVAYKTTSKAFAEQLVNTLENDFGISNAYVTTNQAQTIKFANGEYLCRESYDVNICRLKDVIVFASEINFYQQYKREKLSQMLKHRPIYVSSVTPYDMIPVYDFTEPERHWGVVEGCIVHNCAEEPLPASGACLLGSLNLSEFVVDDVFDSDTFAQAVSDAVVALNEVLDEGIARHPLKEQRQCAKDWHQIGLGVMGIADCLIKLGVSYGSPEAIEICDLIGQILACKAIEQSSDLAKKLGTYPKYNNLVFDSSFFKAHERFMDEKTVAKIKKNGLINSQLLTIAPTGTLSTMLGISGGIEPIFANSYTRMTKSLHGEDHEYKVFTPIVGEYMKKNGITDEADLPDYFVTSETISVEQRIAMQAVWQSHIDASISSTVNLPNEATVEDVEKIYMNAWKSGLKGITVFRAGCARTSILTSREEKEREQKTARMSDTSNLDVIGLEQHLTTGCGSLHICAYFDKNGNLKNTYLSKGSSGGCNNFMIGLSRMISLAARNGVSIHDIVDQLHSCGTCPSYAVRRATKKDVSPGSCCPVAIGNGLMEMWHKFNNDLPQKESPVSDMEICPECGGILRHEMGCVTCTNCGYSKCN